MTSPCKLRETVKRVLTEPIPTLKSCKTSLYFCFMMFNPCNKDIVDIFAKPEFQYPSHSHSSLCWLCSYLFNSGGLQRYLEALAPYCYRDYFEINYSKTKVLIFSRNPYNKLENQWKTYWAGYNFKYLSIHFQSSTYGLVNIVVPYKSPQNIHCNY